MKGGGVDMQGELTRGPLAASGCGAKSTISPAHHPVTLPTRSGTVTAESLTCSDRKHVFDGDSMQPMPVVLQAPRR